MINKNLIAIKKKIEITATRCGRSPDDIQLVAVSKRFPATTIEKAHLAGQTLFGENYIQEAKEKKELLGPTVRFHFIGHLQSNKARIAAEIFDMVETIDRIKIARTLNKHLLSLDRRMDVLIQVNIGKDPNKSGAAPEECAFLLEQVKELEAINPVGLMTITPITDNPEASRPYFKKLAKLGKRLQTLNLLPENRIELSMGMSNDYIVAIEEGATLVRVGTALFGQRPT
ncbi:MAG: YggS family pyridoxal phosphate-dependent enzyme [Proteobacteria bacterium]|nr:MAG: YggS family pyridoxal phosphate-dependent enzyme [Pseudomonadota bacterium]